MYRFLCFIFPELNYFPDPRAALVALEEVEGARSKSLRYWCINIACLIGTGILLEGLVLVISRRAITFWSYLPGNPSLWLPLSSIVIGPLIANLIEIRRVRKQLRSALLRVKVQLCTACGYALTGLSANRCPECGQAFDQKLLQETIIKDQPNPH
ncbi:MAG: hypothetical protein HJJLKODD_00566 [Phycisphaerae bacterium]|nr:hypothetical protein [Phycisphaerae bacterium]